MSYDLIERQSIYNGKKLRLEIHHLLGEKGGRIQMEVVVHPGAVVVLPFLDASTILLIRNFRYPLSQFLLELPAGTLDKGEDPMNAAGRELLEETGYLAHRLKPLFNFYTSPGILNERMYAFAAYDLKKGHAALEPGEQIEPMPVALDEAIKMVKTGEIADGKTIAALLYFDRFARS